eukprot:1271915-Prymnesium_polylepis.2
MTCGLEMNAFTMGSASQPASRTVNAEYGEYRNSSSALTVPSVCEMKFTWSHRRIGSRWKRQRVGSWYGGVCSPAAGGRRDRNVLTETSSRALVARNMGARYCLPGVKNSRNWRGIAVPRKVMCNGGQWMGVASARRTTQKALIACAMATAERSASSSSRNALFRIEQNSTPRKTNAEVQSRTATCLRCFGWRSCWISPSPTAAVMVLARTLTKKASASSCGMAARSAWALMRSCTAFSSWKADVANVFAGGTRALSSERRCSAALSSSWSTPAAEAFRSSSSSAAASIDGSSSMARSVAVWARSRFKRRAAAKLAHASKQAEVRLWQQ